MTKEPFSDDVFDTDAPMVYSALIDQLTVLFSTNNSSERGDALVFVLHLLGDVMQPFHVIQLVSMEYPAGDKGGLLYSLKKVGYRNLHLLSDNVGNVVKKKEVGQSAETDR